MNTRISYIYRDGANYKKSNSVVIEGVFTSQQIQDITDCLSYGQFFIPRQVGLPEERPSDWDYQDDHCWFELNPAIGFETVDYAPTIVLTAEQLYANFMAAKDNWEEGKYSDPDEPGIPIQYASTPEVSAFDYLKAMRLSHGGPNITAIASAIGIPVNRYMELESGKRPPKYEELAAIATTLRLSPNETNTLYDIFGKAWNQFGIPLDIAHYIQTDASARANIRKLITQN